MTKAQVCAVAVALSAMCGIAHAQEFSEASTGNSLRPFVGLGYTWGGRTLVPVKLIPQGTSTEYDEDISAGAGFDLRAGLRLDMPNSPLSLLLSAGMHHDGASGIEEKRWGFRRYPVELIGQWRITPRGSIGLGVRKSLGSKFSVKGVKDCFVTDPDSGDSYDCNHTTKYKSSVAVVLEAEYALTPQWGVKARYVKESFKADNPPPAARIIGWAEDGKKINADHFGVMTTWYFR